MSNQVSLLSDAVEFILKCIAALDEYEIAELANEISREVDPELAQKLSDQAIIVQEVYGTGSLFAEVAEEYRRSHSIDTHPELECDLPDFDDPDFLVKLHTDSASTPDRKRLFIRLWESFTTDDQRAFLSRIDPNGAFRQNAI
ncbi:hypothetical protein DI396_06580 [Litorivita pollutaquae]|uniref:Uncharacterized protein n=1 Tax=Litorivita pollutaquae TaxID=2200892 RepID=A0A2V4NN48_9RHOB|nr:hypothetical protein DI396_06580 [Litorivita pollutaquae]